MPKDDEYFSNKYALTPIYAEDKVDGSDIAVVEWRDVKKRLEWLEDNYEIWSGNEYSS